MWFLVNITHEFWLWFLTYHLTICNGQGNGRQPPFAFLICSFASASVCIHEIIDNGSSHAGEAGSPDFQRTGCSYGSTRAIKRALPNPFTCMYLFYWWLTGNWSCQCEIMHNRPYLLGWVFMLLPIVKWFVKYSFQACKWCLFAFAPGHCRSSSDTLKTTIEIHKFY